VCPVTEWKVRAKAGGTRVSGEWNATSNRTTEELTDVRPPTQTNGRNNAVQKTGEARISSRMPLAEMATDCLLITDPAFGKRNKEN